MTGRDWLRQLLEDTPATQLESSAASGTDTDFYVQNPPITPGTVEVAVNGAAVTTYTVVDGKTVRFATPPAANANITISYSRQTFTDAQLDHYLAEAARDYAEPRQVVYRAAVLTLDTLLTGAATAVNFGAGAEQFDMASIFERLTRLRAIAGSETTARPAVYVEPELPPVLVIPPVP